MLSFLMGGKGVVKVLVVDSNPKNIDELGIALRNRGFQLLEATSYEGGKRLWITEKPQVLIANVRLGQFNGLQLLIRAKAERPDVAAFITSSFSDRVLEAETQRLGGTFLVRPFVLEDLVAAIMDKRSPTQFEGLSERRIDERRRKITLDYYPNRRQSERRRPV